MTTSIRATTAPWQRMLPPESPCPDVDREVIRLVYGRHDEQALVERFAQTQAVSNDEWTLLLDRWNVIRQWQRQRLLDQPALIPDRTTRQRWLSRLLVAHPRVLTRIDYARAWRASTHGAQHATINHHRSSTAKRARAQGAPATPTIQTAERQPTFAAVDQPLRLDNQSEAQVDGRQTAGSAQVDSRERAACSP